ncbi:MAG TPA: LapA family protein [Acidimicrobiales bacterium]
MARKPVHRDPLTEHVAEDDKKGLDRRRQATLIGVAIAVVLLVWFALANLRDVRIDFWVFNRQAPLILVIVISGLLGALIGALVMRRKGRDGDKE